MEHVSTLCATSTVGIAATGFALGHPQQASKQTKIRRKSLSLSLRDQFPLTKISGDVLSTIRPASPRPPRTSQAALSSTSYTTETLADDPHNSCRAKELDSPKGHFAGVTGPRRGRCQTYTNPSLQSTEDQQVNFHARRPSSSWLRRLSIASFQTESRFSTPSPLSPSFNGRASLSLSRPGSQRRPPNKLVKRPPSQHSNTQPLLASGRASTPSAPRRPATSYQRSEVQRHRATHSLTFEPSLATHSPTENPVMQDSEGSWSWRPVFSSRPDGLPERLVRRLSAAGKQKDLGLRRIIPNTGSAPTLLLGTSISNRKSTTVAERDRPHSSIEFRDPFKPVNTAPSRTGTPFTIEESSHRSAPSTSDEGEPGGQVTIADPTDATGSTIPRSSSLDRGEGSAPSSPSNNHPKLEGTILNSPLTPGKRNALGQNTFRLSGTVPRGGFPMPETSAPRRRIISFPLSGEAKADMGCRRDTIKRPSTSDAVPLPSLQHSLGRQSDPNFSFHSCPRTKRHSIAASDPASTIIGSDDTRIFTSGEEDETDFFSDAAFDSIRTHLTTNSSCAPNESRIEAIFDRNFPMGLMGEEPPKLEDLISHGTFTPRASGGNPLFPDTELLQQPNENPTSKRDSLSSDWSDEDTRSLVAALPGEIRQQSLQESCQSALPESNRPEQRNGGAFPATGVLNTNDASNMQPGQDDWRSVNTLPKMNIFDWSEQRRNDSETAGSETRPRTVHGKHLNETRGSRAPGRKVQSTLHLRSQSVPTPREPGAVNESRQTSGKFGTWGLGTKGVSEDWDGDFDFDDGDEDATGGNMKTEENHCRQGMIVPQAIMERQDSLHGQFGLVQELTLLVEELKRLRQQAIVLDIVHGPSNELWKEAEGIINLATIDEESSHSPPRSPSSLAFSFDDSEEDSTHTNSPSKRGSGGSWQGSLLDRTGSNGQNSPHRRRRDSSPEAKFALDMACKSIPQNSASNDTNIVRGRKLPFNTQSLHDLVARSGVVTRALKDVIRSAEGVTTTPGEDSPRSDPPFSRIFDRPSHGHLASERPR